MKEWRVTYLKKISLSMWVVMREREGVENVFFFFFFLPPSTFFLKRDKTGGVYVGVVMGKNQRSVENFFTGYDRVHIYTRTLQYQCNINLNCNEQYNKEIGYDSNTL